MDHSVPASDKFIQKLIEIQQNLRDELQRAQTIYKDYADKHRLPHPFHLGDTVWLLLRNIATTRPCNKLDYRRLGPFKILEQMNEVAFRLQLPPP